MIEDYDFRGKTVKAIHIGRFRVFVCCGETRHAIVHAPSGRVLMCGLTQQQAVRIADSASTYADSNVPKAPRIMLEWAYAVVGGSKERFEDYAERRTGRRPRPVQNPDLGAEAGAMN